MHNVTRIPQKEATDLLGYLAPSDGLLIGGYGNGLQFKPDKPRVSDKGKDIKYLTPASKPYDAILPLCPELKHEYWHNLDELKKRVIQINGKPCIVITEGGFKAIAGCSIGVPTVGLLGVEMGLTSSGKDKKKKRELIPALKRLAEAGFGFIFAFDADCATNRNVKKAQASLVKVLKEYNIPLYNITGHWKVNEGKGMDDYIQGNGADNFKEIVIKPETIEHWEQQLLPAESKGKVPKADILAQEIAEEYKDKFAYNAEVGLWMQYGLKDLGVWTSVTNDVAEHIVSSIVDSKNIEGYGRHSYITDILKKLRCSLTEREWNEANSKHYLPHKNGVLEIATGKFLPHSPGYKFRWQIPRDYNPLASDWSLISDWLDEVTGKKEELKNALICYCNAVLKSRSDLQKCLFTQGRGGTGKTTFQNLLIQMIGESNVLVTTLEDFCSSRFETANAYGKRLVVFSDEDKFKGKLSRFKDLTGQGSLRFERKGKDAERGFIYNGMVTMASNHNPFVSEQSGALKRRLLHIPFDKKPKKKDEKLLDKLVSQLDAFINHILTLDDSYVTETLGNTSNSPLLSYIDWEQATTNDSVAWWINEWLIADKNSKTPVGNNKNEIKEVGDIAANIKTLYGSYHYRCQNEGKIPKSSTAFSKQLLELCNDTLGLNYVEKKRNSHHIFITGLRLRVEGADDNIPTMGELMLDDKEVEDNPTYPTQASHDKEYSPTPNSTSSPTVNPTLPDESNNEVKITGHDKEDKNNDVGFDVSEKVESNVEVEPLPDKDSVEYVGLKSSPYKKYKCGEKVKVIHLDRADCGRLGIVVRESFGQWVDVSLKGDLPKGVKKRTNRIPVDGVEKVKKEE
ncbi:MAG: phage/plasmid primase, P4 family [Rivularia sp. (in: cyanobacteria)]